MPEPKKRLAGRKQRSVEEESPPPVSIDDELTRLAVASLPEQRRKEWERTQRAHKKETVDRDPAESGGSPEDTAEDVAEEITRGARNTAPDADQTPTWYKIIMFGLIIVGLLWLIIWYLMDYSWPIPSIGYGNVAVGVGLMMLGLIMTTRWR
ncbi:MAG: cell division protein CrgA [Kocuria sp.]|nr:cell division protein CrgA [Kocuria sp.]